jgi:uncharacterized oxidoreductase
MTNLISSVEFRRIASGLFEACGASNHVAERVTETLLEASLSGYDSHGIMRVPRYVEECRKGIIKASAVPTVSRSDGAVIMIDGNFGFGPLAVFTALKLSIERARQFGVACFTTSNTNDVARLGSYLETAGSQGLFALLMANDAGGGPAVAPFGSAQPFLSTYPIAAIIPSDNSTPVLIDMSTAITSIGKLRMAANSGQQVAEGILIDSHGAIETDPQTFFNKPRDSSLLPLGGMMMGHKGFALSLIVEALAGALSGSGCSSGKQQDFSRNGVFGLVIDPELFGGRDSFTKNITSLLTQLHSLQPLSGKSESINIPGERAIREREQREKYGIPIDSPTWNKLQNVCEEFTCAQTR